MLSLVFPSSVRSQLLILQVSPHICVLWVTATGMETNEDMQHLDHEIKELNESNLKIEADMMQLQTQVNRKQMPSSSARSN